MLSVPSTQADQLLTDLKKAGIESAAQVGKVVGIPQPSVWII
jgi:hypothetical protein